MLQLRKKDAGLNTGDARALLCRPIFVAVLVLLLAPLSAPSSATPLWQGQEGPIPPPLSGTTKPQPQESSSKRPDTVEPAQPAKPDYNPRDAEKDVEVAVFYMHKGDPDAAIPRLEEAIRLRANYAKPRLLLGQAYEKKHDYANATKYYKEYLQVFPDAPEAKSVQSKIAKLSKKQS